MSGEAPEMRLCSEQRGTKRRLNEHSARDWKYSRKRKSPRRSQSARNGMKTLIHILGPGASGKSTLSHNILEDPSIVEVATTVHALDQHRGVNKPEKVKYTFSGNGVALAGNWKNGSDSIKSMDALSQVIEL